MFRLVALLVVVAALAILWVTAYDGVDPTCDHPTTTLSPDLTKALPKGVADAVTRC